MKDWLAKNGLAVESLGKKQVAEYLETATDDIRSVLELRTQSVKSSVKKFTAMRNMACKDGRARGCFAFYGSHTGRFAGRGIQLQNLKKNSLPELAIARETVRDGNYDLLCLLYDSIPELLSELVRTALIPREGYKFVIADFSAIEARVLSWLAGEQWRMDVFAKNGDIYCETASRMFKKPVVKHGINGELRAKGKQCELSCGYSGGVNALRAMGAIEAGMSEDELQPRLIFGDSRIRRSCPCGMTSTGQPRGLSSARPLPRPTGLSLNAVMVCCSFTCLPAECSHMSNRRSVSTSTAPKASYMRVLTATSISAAKRRSEVA